MRNDKSRFHYLCFMVVMVYKYCCLICCLFYFFLNLNKNKATALLEIWKKIESGQTKVAKKGIKHA